MSKDKKSSQNDGARKDSASIKPPKLINKNSVKPPKPVKPPKN